MKRLILLIAKSLLVSAFPLTAQENILQPIKGDLHEEQLIHVTVDPRIELMTVIQFLGGWGDDGILVLDNIPYRHDIEEYFLPFKDHPASLFLKQKYWVNIPPQLMLYLSDPPEMSLKFPITEQMIKWADGKEKLEKFLTDLRDFAKETSFMDFFNAHMGTYNVMVSSTKEMISNKDLITPLEKYYGTRQKSYNIILSPFVMGNFGLRTDAENNTYDIYYIKGPEGEPKDGLPYFGSYEVFEELAWHEFGHSFSNPIVESNFFSTDRDSSLFDPVSEKLSKRGYNNWRDCLYEHMVRAVQVRLTYIVNGNDAGNKLLQEEKSYGFAYLVDLCDRLKQYENQRHKYNTLTDFYPEIINFWDSLNTSKNHFNKSYFKIPFTGSIYSVAAQDSNIVYILPTQESDFLLQQNIHEYINNMKKKFDKKALILTDKEALHQKLSDKSLLVYGTIEGNLWLKRNQKNLPFKIGTNYILLNGKTFYGDNLRLITAISNPRNKNKGVLIYTGSKSQDIPGINSIFHGPTEYVVADGVKVLESGDYKKTK